MRGDAKRIVEATRRLPERSNEDRLNWEYHCLRILKMYTSTFLGLVCEEGSSLGSSLRRGR